MATHPDRRRWTYERFARLPDDGNRYEVIAGTLHVTPAPGSLHQLVVTRLATKLVAAVNMDQLGWVFVGPINVLFADGDYLEPDLVFVRRDRRSIISDRGIEGPPDLVVEVLSGSTAARDRGIKRERYARYGVPEYWVVDVEAAAIEVLAPDRPGARVVTDMLEWRPVPGGPALTLNVQELLRPVE